MPKYKYKDEKFYKTILLIINSRYINYDIYISKDKIYYIAHLEHLGLDNYKDESIRLIKKVVKERISNA